jgi:agmatine deiminase
MPDESEPHERTWMAFATSEDIWGADLLVEVRKNLADVAKAIARFEPVYMLVTQQDKATAASLCGPSVNLVVCPLDDMWIRDSGPVFVRSADGRKGAVAFNFNGWGGKQAHAADAGVAAFVTAASAALSRAPVEAVAAAIVLEGGGIEVDGAGTAIITESCVLNPNRNPGMTKASAEAILLPLLGLRKIIWLPGVAGKDITDGHTDFYARFARKGAVVAALDPDPASYDHAVTARHLQILQNVTDADGLPLHVTVLRAPATVRARFDSADFAGGYVNYYVANGAVIMPQFGDAAADESARAALQALFPDREVVQVAIDGIAAGGGGIHCSTQQDPRLNTSGIPAASAAGNASAAAPVAASAAPAAASSLVLRVLGSGWVQGLVACTLPLVVML